MPESQNRENSISENIGLMKRIVPAANCAKSIFGTKPPGERIWLYLDKEIRNLLYEMMEKIDTEHGRKM